MLCLPSLRKLNIYILNMGLEDRIYSEDGAIDLSVMIEIG